MFYSSWNVCRLSPTIQSLKTKQIEWMQITMLSKVWNHICNTDMLFLWTFPHLTQLSCPQTHTHTHTHTQTHTHTSIVVNQYCGLLFPEAVALDLKVSPHCLKGRPQHLRHTDSSTSNYRRITTGKPPRCLRATYLIQIYLHGLRSSAWEVKILPCSCAGLVLLLV